MIIGTGIDVVDIARFEEQIARTPGLVARLFTPLERDLHVRSLAARFAAKEAAIKALDGAAAPRDIEVVGSEPPTLRLHGSAAAVAARQGIGLEVSLTHSREIAAAVVLATAAVGAPGPADAADG
jgi:holo-[acyl-carrier protein] synthase